MTGRVTTAILIERHGPPEVLVERTIALGDPGPGQVHLEVAATGVNFAVPVAFLTAWVALFESARVREGETALILNAAGGVGTAAVQLCRWRKIRAIGIAGSEPKRRFVVDRLGAAACFDSNGEWGVEVERLLGIRGVDVALDAGPAEELVRDDPGLAPNREDSPPRSDRAERFRGRDPPASSPSEGIAAPPGARADFPGDRGGRAHSGA